MLVNITKHQLLGWLAFYTVLIDIIILNKEHLGILSTLIVFPYLIYVPGLLTTLALKAKIASFWLASFYRVCLSILLLLLIGLLANAVFPPLGIKESLQTLPLLSLFSGAMTLLLFWANKRTLPFSTSIRLKLKKNIWGYIVPLCLVLLSVCGAIRLNNGASNILTLLLLIFVAIDFYYLYKQARKLTEFKIVWHIFCIGLSLLLLTSLRGWFVTGHDIHQEYYVFELTKQNWHWNVSNFRDPYNACLSITILPTMFASFLKIGDAYIYKILFQIIFALCPVGVFLLANKVANRKLGILSVIYFVSFPTFFMDMPMLNRQEIAFLFFTALLLLLTYKNLQHKLRIIFFGLFGVGLILSHYSTTYAVLMILLVAAIIRFFFERRFIKKLADSFFVKIKRETPSFIGAKSGSRLIVIPMIMFLGFVAFMWNVQLTRTSNGLLDTLKTAVTSIKSNVQKDSRSADTSVSIFGGKRPDPEVLVKDYVDQKVEVRQETEQNYYPESSYDNYKIKAAHDATQPLTYTGKILSKAGINLYQINYVLRQSFARILQVLVLLGLGLIFFSKRLKLSISPEFVSVNLTSIMFLTVLVFVPVLSVDYGLLRAFQQSLVVLALATAIGSLAIATAISKKYALGMTFAIAVTFFAASTGLIAELTGGYIAPLHLQNAGIYYDTYYEHAGEGHALEWLRTTKAGPVQADSIGRRQMMLKPHVEVENDILPAIITKDSYVYLGYTNSTKGVAYEVFRNEGIQYTYPLNFLDQNKNLMYSNQEAKVYK